MAYKEPTAAEIEELKDSLEAYKERCKEARTLADAMQPPFNDLHNDLFIIENQWKTEVSERFFHVANEEWKLATDNSLATNQQDVQNQQKVHKKKASDWIDYAIHSIRDLTREDIERAKLEQFNKKLLPLFREIRGISQTDSQGPAQAGPQTGQMTDAEMQRILGVLQAVFQANNPQANPATPAGGPAPATPATPAAPPPNPTPPRTP